MDIVKNLRDVSLNEDARFFADLIKDEFGYDTCVEKNQKHRVFAALRKTFARL